MKCYKNIVREGRNARHIPRVYICTSRQQQRDDVDVLVGAGFAQSSAPPAQGSATGAVVWAGTFDHDVELRSSYGESIEAPAIQLTRQLRDD
jgi:hypothetical protein